MRYRLIKILLSLIIALSCFLTMPLDASAESGGEFYFDDISVKSGRLFEVTLCIENIGDIASFIAEVSYDAEALEYRETSSYQKGSSFSANGDEEGRITAVYLMKEGLSCTDKTPTLTFKFKSLRAAESEISLRVYDAIDKNGADISGYKTHSATVSVTSSGSARLYSNKKTASQENENTVTQTVSPSLASSDDEETEYIYVKGRAHNTELIVSACVFAAVILSISVFFAYKLGARKSERSRSRVPLEYNKEKRKGKEEV